MHGALGLALPLCDHSARFKGRLKGHSGHDARRFAPRRAPPWIDEPPYESQNRLWTEPQKGRFRRFARQCDKMSVSAIAVQQSRMSWRGFLLLFFRPRGENGGFPIIQAKAANSRPYILSL